MEQKMKTLTGVIVPLVVVAIVGVVLVFTWPQRQQKLKSGPTITMLPDGVGQHVGSFTTGASVILEADRPDPPYAVVTSTHAGNVRLWKRQNGTCYVTVDVAGWAPFFIEASGPICAEAVENKVTLEPSK